MTSFEEKKRHVGFQTRKPAARLNRRKWGLGAPIHMEMTLRFMDMQFIHIKLNQYTPLVSNKALYIIYIYTNHIALAIVPSWAE